MNANISYSVTLGAYVWHYSNVPEEYGITIERKTVQTPNFTDEQGYSDTNACVAWVEAKLAEENTPEQQEKFLAAKRENAERISAEMAAQIERHGAG